MPAVFVFLLLLALALRLGTALFAPNTFWPDEIFQTLEPAHRIAFGYGMVPWEFRIGARSWALPGILSLVMRLTAGLGSGSSGYLAAVVVLLCAWSLVPVVTTYLMARRHHGSVLHAAAAAWACCVWFDLLYFAPKALSEVIAGHALVLALYLARFNEHKRPWAGIAGLLFGITAALRLHLLPAAIAAIVALSWGRRRSHFVGLVAGMVGVLIAAGALDAVTWGTPFHSFWTTFRVNVLDGKASFYGTQPAWHYFAQVGSIWGWPAVGVVLLALLGARKEPALGITATVIMATHALFAHKEYRFIYPCLLIVVQLAGLQTGLLLARIGRAVPARTLRAAALIVVVAAWSLASYGGARRLTTERTGAVFVSDPVNSHWTRHGDLLQAFSSLSERADVCGVGLLNMPWWASAGYTYLHHDIPIFLINDAPAPARWAPSFDVIVARGRVQWGDYRVTRCFGDFTCLLERAGGCARAPGYSINQVLETRGE